MLTKFSNYFTKDKTNKASIVIFDHLRKSRYFQKTSNQAIKKILSLASIKKFKAKTVILKQGQMNMYVYFLIEGSVDVLVDGSKIYSLHRVGDLFGEMSVISGKKSSATIRAKENVELIIISKKILSAIKDNSRHELHHIFYEWFSKILSDKLEATSQKAKLYENLHNHMKSDLQAAKRVQKEISMTFHTDIPQFDMKLKSEYADILGGDLHGMFMIDEFNYGILIGDVSGHGTASALLAVSTFNMFLHFSKKSLSPSIVLSLVNDLALQFLPDERMITMFYGIYNTQKKDIHFSLAGHHSGLVLRGNEVIELSVDTGTPIGFVKSDIAQFQTAHFDFKKGDRLILFTDALFEVGAFEGNILGFDRTIQNIKDNYQLNSEEMIDRLYKLGQSYSPNGYEDDFTLLIFDAE